MGDPSISQRERRFRAIVRATLRLVLPERVFLKAVFFFLRRRAGGRV